MPCMQEGEQRDVRSAWLAWRSEWGWAQGPGRFTVPRCRAWLRNSRKHKEKTVWSDHKVENVAWRRDQEFLWTSLIPSDFGTLDGTWPPFVVSWHSQGRVQRQVQSRALG